MITVLFPIELPMLGFEVLRFLACSRRLNKSKFFAHKICNLIIFGLCSFLVILDWQVLFVMSMCQCRLCHSIWCLLPCTLLFGAHIDFCCLLFYTLFHTLWSFCCFSAEARRPVWKEGGQLAVRCGEGWDALRRCQRRASSVCLSQSRPPDSSGTRRLCVGHVVTLFCAWESRLWLLECRVHCTLPKF